MAAVTYTVIVTREGDAWLADVREVPGAHTFARSLDGLVKSVREVIILMDDLDDLDDLDDDADIDVELTYAVKDETVLAAANLGRDREAAAVRESELQAEARTLARALTGQGYSVRDAARLLAMSPGRISQLTH